MGVLREHSRKIRELCKVWAELYPMLTKIELPEEVKEKVKEINEIIGSLP